MNSFTVHRGRVAPLDRVNVDTDQIIPKQFLKRIEKTGFGQFVERKSNVFKPGEKLIAYLEPVGYGWKEAGDGKYQFGFDVDFLIKQPDGKILAGQENFAKLAETSQRRNREFMVTLTMNVSGAPPGDYVLGYKLRDIAAGKSTVIDLPFKIAQ